MEKYKKLNNNHGGINDRLNFHKKSWEELIRLLSLSSIFEYLNLSEHNLSELVLT
jgi:hypothetical protein